MNFKEFEIIPGTADLKIRAYGTTLQELFCHALKGMFASVKPQGPHVFYKPSRGGIDENPELIYPKFTVEHEVHTRSQDRESLLINFLSDCLYLSDVYNEAYGDALFSVFDSTELQAKIYGIGITCFQDAKIKAVTYHDMNFETIDGLWQATLVFDI